MKDIKFLGLEGDFLILEDQNGEKYRLLLDESILRLSKQGQFRPVGAKGISPREIQEEIRAGRTVDEIAKSTGESLEYVQKFAQPVLDELDHAVLNALTVRIEVAGDRFREPTAWEFGEIIKSRLASSGAGIETWSAKKAPDHGYFIYCDFELGGEPNRATWSYDPKRLLLSPENEMAIKLSSDDKISVPTKLAPVRAVPTNITENLADTVDLASQLAGQAAELASERAELSNPTAPADFDKDISDTADLLEALRRKRAAREEISQPEIEIETAPLQVVEEKVIESAEFETEVESRPEPTSPKRGRASIPSWDEIVFGTKPED